MEPKVNTPTQPKFFTPITTIALTIVIYFAAQLIGGVIVSLIPLLLGWETDRATQWLETNTWAQFLFFLAVELATLLMLYKILRTRKLSFADIGLTKPKLAHLLNTAAGFAIYFVSFITILLIASNILPSLDLEQKQDLGFSTSAQGLELLPVFISLVILPPIVEEIVMRGFLYTGLRIRLAVIKSALIVSILFAAAHLGEAGSGGLLWVAAIDTFVLSIVLCYLRERTKSLWPCIGVHMIKNSLAFVVLFKIFQT